MRKKASNPKPPSILNKPSPPPAPPKLDNKESKLKRYLVFQFLLYHPAGGWADYKESFDELGKEFVEKYQKDCRYTVQVVDSETWEIISN